MPGVGNMPPRARRAWRLVCVIAAVAASTALLAACGDDEEGGGGGGAATSNSSDGGSAATPNAGPKLSGEPIKTMTVAAVNWNGPAYPNILETAKIYEKWVNDNGGIKGRPLEVDVCDEMGDPNQLVTCGRKAISSGAVAVVGSFTLTGDRIVPVLEDADTAWFGVCCAVSPAEANSPITFNFGTGPVATVAYAQKLVDMGCKKPALVILDIPTKNLTIQTITKVLGANGVKLHKTVVVPVAAQDYAPQVAQATGDGTDCIYGGLAETQWAAFMPAFAQSGSEAKIIGSQGNFNEKIAKDFASVMENDIVVGYYPNITDPAFDEYREALEAYDAPDDLDYNSLGGLGTWTGYTAFKEVVEGMSGPINNKTFLEAARKTTSLDTGGKLPELDLTTPWDYQPYGYTRIYNTSVTYSIFGADGKLKVEQPGFFDMAEAARVLPEG